MGCTVSRQSHLVPKRAAVAVSDVHPTIRISDASVDSQAPTENQKKIIRSTWNTLLQKNDADKLGSEIFMCIFKSHPNLKLNFPFRNVAFSALFSDPDFKAHSSRFVQLLRSLVDGLDRLTELVPVLRNLGKLHVRHKDWFKGENLFAFKESILITWRSKLGANWTSEARDAWSGLLDFAVGNMVAGFREKREHHNASDP